MKQERFSLLILSTLLVLLFTQCDADFFDGRISEGTVEYKVDYPSIDPDDMLAGLMPNKMTMHFKDNKFINELSAGMGMFKTNFISNSNDHTLINSVKLINKKYATALDRKAADKQNAAFNDLVILYLNETKMIAGVNCKKALIIFPDVRLGEIYVYYTNDIRFKDPNWGTFFKDLDGVLMEYSMIKYEIVMHFAAEKIIDTPIEDSTFELSDDYEYITIEDLEDEINAIFKTFQ